MYIMGAKPESLQISALLEDPSEQAVCATHKPDECYTNDSSYPLTMEMAGKITDILLKRMGIVAEAPEDRHNNAASGEHQDEHSAWIVTGKHSSGL